MTSPKSVFDRMEGEADEGEAGEASDMKAGVDEALGVVITVAPEDMNATIHTKIAHLPNKIKSNMIAEHWNTKVIRRGSNRSSGQQ